MPESHPSSEAPGTWVVAGSAAALAGLAPLIAARRAIQPVYEWAGDVAPLLADPGRHLPPGAAAVLVAGPRGRSPRQTLPGLFLHDADGCRVPVGLLPDVGAELVRYACAAATVLARPATNGPLIVLGQWEDRFLRVGLRTARWFDRHGAGVAAFQWTAERITRMDMIAGLGCGPGVALYFGHGRPRGWAGYHGVRNEHFPDPWPEPIGALVSLCCGIASRWRTSLSFAETLALRGIFAGGLAAVTKTRHDHNRRLGPALCEVLTGRCVRTLSEWILALPESDWARTPYRFIGDPAAPLAGATGAVERAAAVFAPAADDELPPWEDPVELQREHERVEPAPTS